jgi:type II secretory pathway pseudopilin PulG
MHHDLHRGRSDNAFTLLEHLLVMAVFVIMAALFLLAIENSRQRAKQAACSSNLRQIGLAFHGFAHDHQSLFPMQSSTNVGGTLEFIKAGHSLTGQFFFAYRHFQSLSNDLGDPKLLVCPTDKRAPATNFAALRNENLSYFVNTAAEYARPDSLLAGDRTVETVQGEAGPVLRPGGAFIRWTEEQHIYRGNVLFAGARVEGLTSMALNGKLRTHAGGATGGNTLWLPVGSTAWAPASPAVDASGKVLVVPSRSTRTLEKTFEQLAQIQNPPISTDSWGANGPGGTDAGTALPADNPMDQAKASPVGEAPMPPGVAQDDIAVLQQELGQTNLAQVLAEAKRQGRAGLLTALLWFLLLLALMTLLEIWRRRRVARRLRAPGEG